MKDRWKWQESDGRIPNREPSFGFGNSIFLSIRPGRRSAASRISIRFVAMITLMFFVDSKPSNCTMKAKGKRDITSSMRSAVYTNK